MGSGFVPDEENSGLEGFGVSDLQGSKKPGIGLAGL